MTTEDVPEFLVDELADMDSDGLRSVVAYVEEDRLTLPDSVPENVFTALSLQDKETVAAVGTVAAEFAERKAEGEPVAETGGDSDPSEPHDVVRRVGGTDDAPTDAGDADETDEDWWEDRFY
jgi:hypothetical protein